MENVVAPSSAQVAIAAERAESQTGETERADHLDETFIATIIRIDQSTAERIFRQATR